MGMTCQLRQVSANYAQRLLSNPDEVLQYVDDADSGELPEEAQGEDIDLDKAWHGLHYLLTGTAWEGREPYCYLLSGGEQIGDAEEHDVGHGPVRILLPPQVALFSDAVQLLTPGEVHRRLNAKEMTRLDIYPEVWAREGPAAQENLDYLTENAADLQAFLRRTVTDQKAVVIYLS